MCKRVGLNHEDMEIMTIGFCLDFIDEWVEQNKTDKEHKAREASQSDFDNF